MREHSEYEELLSALIDGELDEAEKAELQAHLESCAECRDYLRLLAAMHDGLREQPDPPEKLREGIMYKIGLERKRKRSLPGAYGRWTAVAAVCCLAVLGAVKLGGMGAGKGADSAAPMMASATGGTAETLYMAADNGFAAFTGTTANADGANADSAMEEPVPLPEGAPAAAAPMEEAADTAVANDAFFYRTDTETNTELTLKSAPESVYNAAHLPGYEIGLEELASADCCAVGILYALPEGYPAENWTEVIAPSGQRRWVVKREAMDALTAKGLFDEVYYGDLLASEGLIIELTEGTDEP